MSSGSLLGSGGSVMTRVAGPRPYFARVTSMSRQGNRLNRTKPRRYGTFKSRLPFWYTRAGTRLGVGREQGLGLGGATPIVGAVVVRTGMVGRGSALMRSLRTSVGETEGPALSQAHTRAAVARTATRQIADPPWVSFRPVARE